ncbi:MAG TPA: DUF2911 domain-containing protein [Candidatus Xenobia bacterium]|jgi:hypothetical protein
MRKLFSLLAVMAVVLAATLPALARVSPHETTSTVIDGNRITIVYGRPYTKNPKTGEVRKIWGGLVPYGEVWRTGADEATLLITQQPITLGTATLPAGAYTLWTLPNADGTAQLIINNQVGQWGVGPNSYDAKRDVARVQLQRSTVAPVDQFTMAVAKNPSGGGAITLSWETTQWSVPVSVAK